MVRRPDLVLALIPVAGLSGVLAERLAPLVVGGGAARATAGLPLDVVGYLAALAVVVYAIARGPSA